MLQSLIDAVAWLLSNLYLPIQWLLDGLVYVLLSIPYLILDGILIAVKTFFSALDMSAIALQWVSAWSSIPQQAIYVMNAIALPQAITLIGSAYALRFAINIIPASLTRV